MGYLISSLYPLLLLGLLLGGIIGWMAFDPNGEEE